MPSKLHPGTCLLHVYSNKNLNKERLKWGLYKKCWLHFEKFMCFNLYIRNSFERFEVTDLRLKMFALFNSQLCLGWRESRRLSGPPSGTTRSMMLTRRWGTGLISGKNRNLKMSIRLKAFQWCIIVCIHGIKNINFQIGHNQGKIWPVHQQIQMFKNTYFICLF